MRFFLFISSKFIFELFMGNLMLQNKKWNQKDGNDATTVFLNLVLIIQ